MKRRYRTVDVFTDSRFGGNPLAVVLDAEGLDTEAMQRIAAEFNYSETSFVLPPQDPANSAEVRIFTPKRELPFAGHPNVGTAFVLAAEGRTTGGDAPGVYRFEERAGLVPVRLLADAEGRTNGAELTAPEAFRQDPGRFEIGEIAACLSLDASVIDTVRHGPVVVSVGLAFVAVEVTSRAALAAARPDVGRFAQTFPRAGADAIYLYTRDVPASEAGLDRQARMFSPLHAIGEDPATGSATAAVGALQAVLDGHGAGEAIYRFGQGFDMGRPSRLTVRVVTEAGRPVSVHVGGSCVAVMDGTIETD